MNEPWSFSALKISLESLVDGLPKDLFTLVVETFAFSTLFFFFLMGSNLDFDDQMDGKFLEELRHWIASNESLIEYLKTIKRIFSSFRRQKPRCLPFFD